VDRLRTVDRAVQHQIAGVRSRAELATAAGQRVHSEATLDDLILLRRRAVGGRQVPVPLPVATTGDGDRQRRLRLDLDAPLRVDGDADEVGVQKADLARVHVEVRRRHELGVAEVEDARGYLGR
jgi:hypothetical protein